MDNKGILLHDFVTRGLDQEINVRVEGGKQRSVTFTAPTKPGECVYVCQQPGHEEAGMKGLIQVK